MRTYLILAGLASIALYMVLCTGFDLVRKASVDAARAAEASIEAIQ